MVASAERMGKLHVNCYSERSAKCSAGCTSGERSKNSGGGGR